jgi:hypothetical protein
MLDGSLPVAFPSCGNALGISNPLGKGICSSGTKGGVENAATCNPWEGRLEIQQDERTNCRSSFKEPVCDL